MDELKTEHDFTNLKVIPSETDKESISGAIKVLLRLCEIMRDTGKYYMECAHEMGARDFDDFTRALGVLWFVERMVFGKTVTLYKNEEETK